MAIAFTNTDGTGHDSNNGGSSTADESLTMPTDAASGKLLVMLVSQRNGLLGTTQTLTSNITPNSITYHQFDSTQDLSAAVARYTFPGAPGATITANNSDTENVAKNLAVLIIDGFDTGTPFRVTPAFNTGTTTTVTFPDTASINDGDMVIRWVTYEGSNSNDPTIGTTPGTQIFDLEPFSNFSCGIWAGYSIKSGSGAPGTATATLSGAQDWLAATVVVSVAAGGGGLFVNPFSGRGGAAAIPLV